MKCFRTLAMFAVVMFFAVSIVLFSSVFSPAYAVEYPEPIGYVNDFANLLTRGERNNLEAVLSTFEKRTSIDLVVVIMSSLEGNPIDAYTLGLANTWSVGKDGKNNGIVLLYVVDERKVDIQIGRGLGSVFTPNAA